MTTLSAVAVLTLGSIILVSLGAALALAVSATRAYDSWIVATMPSDAQLDEPLDALESAFGPEEEDEGFRHFGEDA